MDNQFLFCCARVYIANLSANTFHYYNAPRYSAHFYVVLVLVEDDQPHGHPFPTRPLSSSGSL